MQFEQLRDKKVLIIVESSKKAAYIRALLKDASYNNISVLATVGHIISICDHKDSYKNTGVFINNDFKLNLQLINDKLQTAAYIQEQINNADFVYIMTEKDREGELLAWSLITFLHIKKEKCSRVYTNELTTTAILAALTTSREIDLALVKAALARMAIDKMIGYSLSPIVKTYVGAKSVGRCQSAALKLVVDREKEIINFIPKTYYDVSILINNDTQQIVAKYAGLHEKGKKTKNLQLRKEEAVLIKESCKNTCFNIINIREKKKELVQILPFNTASLLEEAITKLNLSVKQIMNTSQFLFENGFITYYKTDSTAMSDEFLEKAKVFVKDTFGVFNYTKSNSDCIKKESAFECIRITDLALTPEKFNLISGNSTQKKLYELIWKRTVSTILDKSYLIETDYVISNKEYTFSFSLVNESTLTQTNAVKIEQNETITPQFKLNDTIIIGDIIINKQQTKPIERYTEASLIDAFIKNNIWRPNSFYATLDTLLSPTRNYASIVNKHIIPTNRGVQLSKFLDRSFPTLMNLNYTKELEKSLDRIAANTLDYKAFLKGFTTNLILSIEEQNKIESFNKQNFNKKCPICNAPMVLRRSKFGKLFYGCSNYPKCTGIINYQK